MKNLINVSIGSMMFCASLVLISCKKQIAEKAALPSEASPQTVSAGPCKPAVLGMYDGEWQTLAQKWYSNGKVKYLKAQRGRWTPTFDELRDFKFVLDWGQVSYQGNQVYLTDVTKDQVMMRVTLDNQGRPIATYYDYRPSAGTYMRDTTYYYYKGDRLDYMISLYGRIPDEAFPTPIHGWWKFVFSYDDKGNVTKAEFPESLRYIITYDYTKPVTGIMNNLHITSSLKLLEYLELIELPMHYAVTSINMESLSWYPDPAYHEVFYSPYKDYAITDGLVNSYVGDFPFKIVTFYNGWECGTGPLMNVTNAHGKIISNLQQFHQLYSTMETH